MTTYTLSDGDSSTTIEADSLADARQQARDWVAEGEWGQHDEDASTTWVRVHITEGEDSEQDDDVETLTVAVDPDEPDCSDASSDGEHRWTSPIEIVGGCEESPGVQCHGGGVIIHEVCAHCGLHRHTDTWAQDRQTGEQGLESVRYSRSDDD